MGASLADVTDVLRKQIEANAEMAAEMRAQTKLLEKTVGLLEELRDNGGASYEDEDDDDEDDEDGDEVSAGIDGAVQAVASEIRDRIRSKGLKGLLNRKKKTNGQQAPKETE